MTPVFSTAYLPPIVYVAKALQQTELLIESKETFPKQTYRNRAEIMTAGGVRTLTVPVIRDNHSRTEEVGIDYKERWNIIHLRTLAAAYSASPYYLYYKDDLEALLTKRYEKLMELNEATLKWIFKLLKIDCQLQRTEDYQKVYEEDFRNTFSPKHPYPTEGMENYYQVFSDRLPFTPNLSIIDLLMNLGPEAKDYLKRIS
jgi:hypothetical protein